MVKEKSVLVHRSITSYVKVCGDQPEEDQKAGNFLCNIRLAYAILEETWSLEVVRRAGDEQHEEHNKALQFVQWNHHCWLMIQLND